MILIILGIMNNSSLGQSHKSSMEKKDILRTHSNRLGAHRHKKYFVRQIQEIAEPLIYETTKLLD